jgi:hypothetical protein
MRQHGALIAASALERAAVGDISGAITSTLDFLGRFLQPLGG